MFINDKFIIFILSVLILLSGAFSRSIIWDEVINSERLKTRINNFNEWYSKFNPHESKVEARLTSDPEFMRIGLFAKNEINADDVYLRIDKNKMISSENIYETPIGPIIKRLESIHGYDDYTNLVFFLLHEMNNKNSEWKYYLDLLPRQPTSVAFKYWDKKQWIEDELVNTPILKKIVDYKFLLEKKARYLYSIIVANNTNTLDAEFYNKENIEWACLIIDSRLIYVDYQAFLIPMLDFANYRENPLNPNRVLNPKFDKDSVLIKAGSDVASGEQIFEGLRYSNDKYLLYHGITLENNYHDCYLLNLGFLNRKEDKLKHQRKNFFAKFFLYDDNATDLIEECVSIKNPFPRRLLFYYYTLLMDKSDLEKMDPKRIGLEKDKIILETTKNALQTNFDLYPTKMEEDLRRLQNEKETFKREILKYIIEQKKYLLRLIEHYQYEINKLMKEDIL